MASGQPSPPSSQTTHTTTAAVAWSTGTNIGPKSCAKLFKYPQEICLTRIPILKSYHFYLSEGRQMAMNDAGAVLDQRSFSASTRSQARERPTRQQRQQWCGQFSRATCEQNLAKLYSHPQEIRLTRSYTKILSLSVLFRRRWVAAANKPNKRDGARGEWAPWGPRGRASGRAWWG